MLSVVVARSLDIVVLTLYLVVLAAIGFYFSRRNVSTEEYFVGGRPFGKWKLGLSMMATDLSSVTFLGFPAAA